VAGFQNVFVGIYDPAPDREGFRFRCAVGWRDADDPSHQLLTRNHVAPLLDRRFIVEGCALVPFEAVSAVFPQVEAGGFLSAPGPQAWHDHWLFVPLHGSAGELIGIARLDEPLDLLLPSQEKLRALRLFSNHLSQAVVLRRVRSRLTRAATTDPLTRLPNRRSFAARIATETARAARYGRPCALIVIDLDRLKSINDAKGHDAGDAALVALGHVIGSHMRAGDSAFRIGGDEFALLLPETTAREAESAASRIRDTLASLDEPLNASFGIAVAPVDATDPALLIRLADEAMYADKARKSQRS
jgi:diguanylate cyclase (GGDEF)-like protein